MVINGVALREGGEIATSEVSVKLLQTVSAEKLFSPIYKCLPPKKSVYFQLTLC